MRPQTAEPDYAGSLNAPRSAPLRGLALIAARAAWVSVVALALVLFVFAVPAEFGYLQTACAGCDGPRLTVEGAQKLKDLGLSIGFYAGYNLALEIGFAAASSAVAGVIFWRRSDDSVALLGALAVLVWGITFPNATLALAESNPVWELPTALLGFLGLVSFTLFFYMFPDGRFVPRWTRWLALALASLVAPSYVFPDSPASISTWPAALQLPFYLVWMGSLVAVQIYRYRSVSPPAERRQTRWVVFGFTAAIFGFLAAISVYPFLSQPGPLAYLIGNTGIYLSMLMIPLSIGVAILRYRLFGIDLIINRALVYGALTACVVGIYVLVVGYLGELFRTDGNLLVSLVATGVVAVLFAPLRYRLQRIVNRLMYGERDDPYAVLSRLGERLEATLAPGAMLPAVVDTVAETLNLPYAAIEIERDGLFETVASAGEPAKAPVYLTLVYGGETVGRLVLGKRAGEEDFASTDRRLLGDLARQAGVAVHAALLADEAVRLSADLQRSRERLVNAREEERRRLRRDLHDGLGPQLASLTMKAEAARDLVTVDSDRAESLLEDLMGQAQDAVADVRRLVYALRPPALDALGLVGAIRSHASQYNNGGLRVEIEAPEGDSLPPLPAAVEVAAYRIALEAMNNAARHAGARNCEIRLSLDEEPDLLILEVSDDGRGIGEDRKPGVGLTSMRERAEELGGSCVVEHLPSGGTRVGARLPTAQDITETTLQET
jgi:signal transduction histidine kinase